MNGKTADEFGYIHANSYPNEEVTVDNLYAFKNENIIINPCSGKIIVKSFYGDEFTYRGGGVLSTENIKTESGFVMTSEFKRVLICDIDVEKKKIAYISKRARNASPVFSFLVILLLHV